MDGQNPGMPAERIRVAAAGDIHASEAVRDRLERAFAEVSVSADLVLLAGDLTTHGEPDEAVVLADAARTLSIPVYAVLGNHDFHVGRDREVVSILEDAGISVLERASAVAEVNGTRVGVVGTKGFVGGFPGVGPIPDFGEPLMRQLYAETTAEVTALERELDAVADCPLRLVLMHYAPAMGTLVGEPEPIWPMLGSHRLGVPISERHPDLVVHGHAHEGTFEAEISGVPVYNVAIHVTGRDFYVFELEPRERRDTERAASVSVEEPGG